MDPYVYDDYRLFLNALVEQEQAPRGFRAALARAAGCQASYFSQVLKNRSHLTEDQLLGVTAHLDLPTSETDYILLLLRYSKAGTKKLQEYLFQAIQVNRQGQLNLKNRVTAERDIHDPETLGIYFSSWIPSAVHLLTSDPEHQSIESIAKRLNLTAEKIKDTLIFLERSGFVEKISNHWKYKRGSIHIPKESAFQSALQTTRRELANRSIALNNNEALHFSSIFTIDPEDMSEIQKLFSKLVEKSHKVIQNSGTKKLACMCLDLFEVV